MAWKPWELAHSSVSLVSPLLAGVSLTESTTPFPTAKLIQQDVSSFETAHLSTIKQTTFTTQVETHFIYARIAFSPNHDTRHFEHF